MSNENKLSTAPAGAVAQKTAGGGALSVFADGASFNIALFAAAGVLHLASWALSMMYF